MSNFYQPAEATRKRFQISENLNNRILSKILFQKSLTFIFASC